MNDLKTLKDLDADIDRCDDALVELEKRKLDLFTKIRDELERPGALQPQLGANLPNREGTEAPGKDDAANQKLGDMESEQARARKEKALDLDSAVIEKADKDLAKLGQIGTEVGVPMPPMGEWRDAVTDHGVLTLVLGLGTVSVMAKQLGERVQEGVNDITDRAIDSVAEKLNDREKRQLDRQELKEWTQIENDHRDQRQLLHDLHERTNPDPKQVERDVQVMDRLQRDDVKQFVEKWDERRNEMIERHEQSRSDRARDKDRGQALEERTVEREVKELIQEWDRSKTDRTIEQPWSLTGR